MGNTCGKRLRECVISTTHTRTSSQWAITKNAHYTGIHDPGMFKNKETSWKSFLNYSLDVLSRSTFLDRESQFMFAQYSKNAHMFQKKAKNAHASLRGIVFEDILGETSLTIHDDTKHNTHSHRKRTIKNQQLGHLVWIHSTKPMQ